MANFCPRPPGGTAGERYRGNFLLDEFPKGTYVYNGVPRPNARGRPGAILKFMLREDADHARTNYHRW
jgi:hypothetical protein